MTLVMGVVNVTADSFSDGGKYLALEAAIARGLELSAAGADIIDVGGESTRPGAHRVAPEIEAQRVVPVIRELADRGLVVSVDTMRAAVAAAAIDAGAAIVNDVSGGLADPEMAAVLALSTADWVLMHWRSAQRFEHSFTTYRDVVSDVRDDLLLQVSRAIDAGVPAQRLIIDPGLGFAKNSAHNWALLRSLETFVQTDYRVLVGASRKRFLGELLADDDGPRPPAGREVATAVVSALSAQHGAWGVRVHDVRASVDAIAVSAAWARTGVAVDG